MQRHTMSGKAGSNGSFAAWMEQQNRPEGSTGQEDAPPLMDQLRGFNDGLSAQLQELSGSLPDAPLSQAFRQRVQYAIYCLLGSVFFALLAVLVGLPTLVLKPTKFVLCITLSTVLAIASVVIIQKPSVFIKSIIDSGPGRALPILCLFVSFLITLYAAIFVHRLRYLAVVLAAGVQLLCIFWYVSSFIPGGQAGLQVLLRMTYVLINTAMQPCIFICKRAFYSFVAALTS